MPWCYEQAVLQRVADALHLPLSGLAAEWLSLVSEATKDAAADIVSILANKAYGATQIAAADQFSSWQERLAFVITMQRGTAIAAYPQEQLKALDPRDMIEKLGNILINGVPTPPDGTGIGGISKPGRLAYYDATIRRTNRLW